MNEKTLPATGSGEGCPVSAAERRMIMKCKYKESCGYEFCLDDCCPEFEAAVETNADRIRAMSDEGLGEWLCSIATAECCDRSCPARNMCDLDDNGLIKWLKQPADGQSVPNDKINAF